MYRYDADCQHCHSGQFEKRGGKWHCVKCGSNLPGVVVHKREMGRRIEGPLFVPATAAYAGDISPPINVPPSICTLRDPRDFNKPYQKALLTCGHVSYSQYGVFWCQPCNAFMNAVDADVKR